MIQKKDENGEKYATATTEAEFHEAFKPWAGGGADAETGGADRSAYERGRGHRGGDRPGATRPARLGKEAG